MKTKAISSFFVLFAIASGIVAMTPDAFADHTEVTILPALGSSTPGCEETTEGCFIPSTATVDVGGVVIMSNTDSAAHTFTAGTPEGGPSGEFDTSLLMINTSFEWIPETAGEVPYFCMVHPWMKGLIIVQEAEQAHAETAATVTGMLSDSTEIKLRTSELTSGEAMDISIEFEGAEHVNYDIMATQNGDTILDEQGVHQHDGYGAHATSALSSSDPLDITITFQGYGVDDPKTGPIGEEVVFSNVVPEFGTIAMMILAVAIISIVAVTTKSRIVPRF